MRLPAFELSQISAHLQTDARGETLTLQFGNALPQTDIESPQLPPDVRCFRCRELNAPDALWCWNCYARLETPRVSAWRQVASTVVPCAVIGALGSSGWWPRRARLWILGAGLSGLSAAFIYGEKACQRQRAERERKATQGIHDRDSPIVKLAADILGRVLENGESQIRLQEHGNVFVSFFKGEWREQMSLPASVWPALRERLLQIAREGFISNGKKRRISAQLHTGARGETLDLTPEIGELNTDMMQ